MRQIIEFINGIEEFIVDYCRSRYRAGSDIIMITEPSASSDLISPKMFRNIVKSSLIGITNELKEFKILIFVEIHHLLLEIWLNMATIELVLVAP